MSTNPGLFKIAILDDYQNVARTMADWSILDGRAAITVFNDHLADADAVVARLQPFEIVCVMRERTPMTRDIIERLPNLRLIASTATVNASIDLAAAAERGVQLVHTGYSSAPTVELTWALILADARHLVVETTAVRGGGWQQSVGEDLNGRTLGLLGLGNIGSAVARIGKAFGMNLIAWSQNLTAERAAAVDAVLVPKEKLFQQADVITIHLVLSRRTRGLVGAPELRLRALLIHRAGRSSMKLRSLTSCEKAKSPGPLLTCSTKSRSRQIIHSANFRTCWQRRILVTCRAAYISASTRIRWKTSGSGSMPKPLQRAGAFTREVSWSNRVTLNSRLRAVTTCAVGCSRPRQYGSSIPPSPWLTAMGA
jgi:hypothetical protein